MLLVLALVVVPGLAGIGVWLAISRDPGPSAAQRARAAAAGAAPAIDVELRVLPAEGRTPSADDLEVIRMILENRAAALSVGSPTVSVQGADTIVVHLPGNQDTTAIRRAITTTGRFDVQRLSRPAPDLGTFLDVARDRYLFAGDQLDDAAVSAGPGDAVLELVLTVRDEGRDLLAAWASQDSGEVLVVTLDGVVIGVVDPSGVRGATLSLALEGSRAAADDLLVILRYGQLPYPVEEIAVQESRTGG